MNLDTITTEDYRKEDERRLSMRDIMEDIILSEADWIRYWKYSDEMMSMHKRPDNPKDWKRKQEVSE